MAKESMKAREVKRRKMVEKYAAKKAALKKAALADADGNIDYEALTRLQKIPRNASRIRLHNRCELTGRPKGYMRQFGISRIQVREMASAGLIPGVKKAALADADGNIDYEALTKLQKLPRNASYIRLHNRCELTGRPKGYMRQFGISRIQFREMASAGLIPGVKKASW